MKLSQLVKPVHDEEAAFRFVPGHYFFCRTLTLPEESIEGEELHSYAELSLESLSPFPLEQLCWGYLVDAGQVFLYAACRPRLPGELLEGWPEARYVYPSFLPLLLARAEQATVYLVQDASSVTLVHFDGQSCFPAQLVSTPLPEPTDEGEDEAPPPETAEALVQRLRLRLPASARELQPIAVHLKKTTEEGDKLRFLLQSFPNQELTYHLAGDDALWAADVREPEFAAAERKRRKADQRAGWLLAGAGVAVMLLLCLIMLNALGGWLVSRREALVMEQDPAAFRVQQNSDFLLQLEQFSGAPFRPFTILAAANQVLRERQPRRIEFTSANLSNNNEVTIQGDANNVDEVNRYSERLRESGYFSLVELADVRTRRGQVNFSLNLRFNPESMDTLLGSMQSDTVANKEPKAESQNEAESQP